MSEPAPLAEADLVRRARDGDGEAWNAIVEHHRDRLKGRIRRRLSAPVRRKVSDSDVLQEAWILANRQLDTFEYRDPVTFRAWLGGIADNAARTAVKRFTRAAKRDARTEVTRDARAATAHVGGQGPTPSAAALGREMRVRVRKAMVRLAEDHRTVIELLQHRRVTIAEAAELMGRSENAIKKLHGRALAELARLLEIRGRRRNGTD